MQYNVLNTETHKHFNRMDYNIYIYIAIAVVGMLVGASLILQVLRLVAGIFSAFGGRRYYDDDRDRYDRDRNGSGGCLIQFILVLALLGLGGKIVYDKFIKQTDTDTELRQGSKQPKEKDPNLYKGQKPAPAPQQPRRAETPDYDDVDNAVCENPYVLKSRPYARLVDAEQRVDELKAEFNARLRIVSDGDGSAVCIGPYCTLDSVKVIQEFYGLPDWTILPARGLKLHQ